MAKSRSRGIGGASVEKLRVERMCPRTDRSGHRTDGRECCESVVVLRREAKRRAIRSLLRKRNLIPERYVTGIAFSRLAGGEGEWAGKAPPSAASPTPRDHPRSRGRAPPYFVSRLSGSYHTIRTRMFLSRSRVTPSYLPLPICCFHPVRSSLSVAFTVVRRIFAGPPDCKPAPCCCSRFNHPWQCFGRWNRAGGDKVSNTSPPCRGSVRSQTDAQSH